MKQINRKLGVWRECPDGISDTANGFALISDEDLQGLIGVGAVVATAAVPTQIDSIKLKRWLVDNDKYATLDTYIATQGNFPSVKAWRHVFLRWKEKAVWLRSDPMVNQMGQIIGLTPEQIDAAFREADANYQ